jgi:predicted RecA/RadA family phage recombinase
MKNYVQPGKTITATAPYDRLSGQGAKIAGIFGVAATDILSTKTGEFDLEGVFDLAKATGAAWTEGQAIYWDDTAKNCTPTVGSNLKIGVAILMDSTGTLPVSADTVGRVRLNGVF